MDKQVKVKYKDIILDKTGQFSGVTSIDLNGCNLLSRGTTTPVGDYQITGVSNGNISYGSSLFDKCNRFTTLDNITYNGLTNASAMFRGTAIESIPEGIDWSTMKSCQQMFSGAPITGEISMYLPAVTACNDMFNDTNLNSLSFTSNTINNTYTNPVTSGNTIRHLSLTYPNATAVTNNLTLPALEDYTVNAPVASALIGPISKINDDAIITFNTPQVTNIGSLFAGCQRANLDKVHLPFEQITHAVSAFSGSSITSFTSDLSNLINGSSMFLNCKALTELDLELPKLTNMGTTSLDCMFSGCSSLKKLRIHTPSLLKGSDLYGCSALEDLTVVAESLTSGVPKTGTTTLTALTFNIPSMTSSMALTDSSGYKGLKYSNITSSWSGAPITSSMKLYNSGITTGVMHYAEAKALNGACSGCADLVTITIDAPKCEGINGIFSGCTSLTNEGITLNTAPILYANNAFNNCTSLTSIPFDCENVISGQAMLYGSSVSSVDLNMPKATNLMNMLNNCSALTRVSLSAPSIGSGRLMYGAYPLLTSVTLDLPSATTVNSFSSITNYPALQQVSITANITTTNGMINSAVTDARFVFPNATNISNLCKSASTLTSVTVVADNAENASSSFAFCSSIADVADIDFDFTRIKTASNMLQGCTGLKDINLTLPEATSCTSMLSGCSSLESINFSAHKCSGSTPTGGTYPVLTSLTLDLPAYTDNMLITSTTYYPVMKIVDVTTGWSGNTGTVITNQIGSGVTNATLTFPNAIGVNTICRDAKALTGVTINAPLATTYNSTFNGCSSLTEVNIQYTENIVSANSMFQGCSSLTSFEGDMRSVTSVASMFHNCTKLSYVSMIVNESNSAWTLQSFSIHSTAPCRVHRYCFSRNDENVRLIFTADNYGSSNYQQIDCTNDNRTETLTADTIIVLNDNGSYISDPPAGPASNPNAPIHINILLDDVFVTTTPSQLSRGKFTWSKEPHEGWTQWQDKLWYQHEPMND